MLGNRMGTLAKTQSTTAAKPLIGNSATITGIGESTAGCMIVPEEPTCRFTTVPVSSHAARKGSQCLLCMLGKPSPSGFSEKLTARTPRAALRRISSAASTGSARNGN
jgi:hypothetical protein